MQRAVRALLTLLLCVCCFVASPAHAQFGELIAFESSGNTTYYLDADTGDDESFGTRPDRAWKTLTRINSSRFAPGDKIYIKAGTTYHGMLFPKGAGIPGLPITIDSFGKGPRPAIHADGNTTAALLLENTNAWHIKNLELTNTGDEPEAFRYGLCILAEDTGPVGDFKLVNLLVHDVNGLEAPGLGEGAAITFRNRGTNAPTRFDGLLVEGCTIKDSGRHGIYGETGYRDRNRRVANVNIVIRENTIQNVAGDGIHISGCDNAMIEYNTVAAAGRAGSGEAGGVTLQACDNSLVQFNQVSETAGGKSAALRCGPDSRENTFQFNFTRDNGGAMTAVVSNPTDASEHGVDAGNSQTAVRYNISQNDAAAFRLIGPVAEAHLYNNTIYTGPDTRSVAVQLSDSPGMPPNVIIANNVFYTQGTAILDLGMPDPSEDTSQQADATDAADTPSPISFMHNAYFGDHQRPDGELNPVTADPMLVEPGTGVSLEDGLECYHTQPDSPLRAAGVRLPSHGRYDFWTHPVPAGAMIDIGAHQAPSDNPASSDPDVPAPALPKPGPPNPQ